MKLSKEEWAEIDRIKSLCHDNADKAALNVRIDFLCACLEKTRPKPERFTYEWKDCDRMHCDKGKVYTNGNWFKCQGCDGFGKCRVKVKRTAHSV